MSDTERYMLLCDLFSEEVSSFFLLVHIKTFHETFFKSHIPRFYPQGLIY